VRTITTLAAGLRVITVTDNKASVGIQHIGEMAGAQSSLQPVDVHLEPVWPAGSI